MSQLNIQWLMGFMEFIHSYPFISINIHLYPLKQSSVSNAMNIDLRCHPAFFSVTPRCHRRHRRHLHGGAALEASQLLRGDAIALPDQEAAAAQHAPADHGEPWEMHWKKLVKQVRFIYIYIILYAYIYITHIYIYIYHIDINYCM